MLSLGLDLNMKHPATGKTLLHLAAEFGASDLARALAKNPDDRFATVAEFSRAVHLSGVNSINWARIAAQCVYYFTSAAALGACGPACCWPFR